MNTSVHLAGLSQAELVSFLEEVGEPAYRGRQIFAAVHHRRMQDLNAITDLPKRLRTTLTEPSNGVYTYDLISLHFRRWHAALFAQDPRQPASGDCIHTRSSSRYHLLFLTIRMSTSMQLLSNSSIGFICVR